MVHAVRHVALPFGDTERLDARGPTLSRLQPDVHKTTNCGRLFHAARGFRGTLMSERTQESWLERMMSLDELDELLGLSTNPVEEERLQRLDQVATDHATLDQADAPNAD